MKEKEETTLFLYAQKKKEKKYFKRKAKGKKLENMYEIIFFF